VSCIGPSLRLSSPKYGAVVPVSHTRRGRDAGSFEYRLQFSGVRVGIGPELAGPCIQTNRKQTGRRTWIATAFAPVLLPGLHHDNAALTRRTHCVERSERWCFAIAVLATVSNSLGI